MTIQLLDAKPPARPVTGYERAPEGSYWVFTESGAAVHNKLPGQIIEGNPYWVWSYWVLAGDVTTEQLE